VSALPGTGASSLAGELRKFPAFFRRDLLVMWSYRLAFFMDWVNVITQVVVFSLVSKLVDATVLPTVDGNEITYLEFVITGIAVATMLQISFARVVNAIREEQLMGTLESVLMTPTSPFTVLLGSVSYDMAYVPVRTFLFFGLTTIVFEITLNASGVLPFTAILLSFIPFAWGLGMLGAAAVVTYRRGVSALTFLVSGLMLGSSAYFPIAVLPSWIQRLAELNPVTIALDGARSAILGDGGWESAASTIKILLPLGVIAVLVGFVAVRAALARERRRGTLGLY
jgi:ABC-2 type transport system permease protein